METNSTKNSRWSWTKNYKKTASSKTRYQIYEKIIETNKNKEGLKTDFLWKILSSLPNFIGVMSQDYLENLKILSFPVTFIINLDLSNQPGSHWLAFSITTDIIEIYDSLGMKSEFWNLKPLFLLNFLKKFSISHKCYMTPQLQPNRSFTCGFYCIFFLLSRQFLTFEDSLSFFTSDYSLNDTVLTYFLSQ
jgi:hypothetical protein